MKFENQDQEDIVINEDTYKDENPNDRYGDE